MRQHAVGQPCNWTKGGQNDAITARRQSLLVFLKSKAKERLQLKQSDPDLFKYFENVWGVRENHVNKDLQELYIYVKSVFQTRMSPFLVP